MTIFNSHLLFFISILKMQAVISSNSSFILSKCQMNMVTYGGVITNMDGLCLLTLNVLLDKIYLIIWIWFAILSILSFISVSYTLSTLFTSVRSFIIFKQSGAEWSKICKLCKKLRVSEKTKYSINDFYCIQFGDWWVVFQISKNVNYDLYTAFITELSRDKEIIV